MSSHSPHLDPVQKVQEDQYIFPYHHIPRFKNYFTQSLNWPWGLNYAASLEYIIKRVKQEAHITSIVDIGCGDGRLTKELHQAFRKKKVVGIDYSQKAVNLAQLMFPEGNYQCFDIIQGNQGHKFDAAILMEVFEHIHPDLGDKFLAGVANLMQPNGILFLTVPHSNVPVEEKHYRHFSQNLLRDCLEKHFYIEEFQFIDKISTFKKIIDLILVNRLFILNSGFLNYKLYQFYKQNLFLAKREEDCQRLFVKARLR